MKKLTLVGVSLVVTSTGEGQETVAAKSRNIKPGQQVAFISQNNEQLVFTYEDLLNQLRGSNGSKIKNIQIENNPIELLFLNDLSINVSIKGQTDAPANVRGGDVGE